MVADDKLLTTDELADKLQLSPRTISELARAGKIPEIRISERIRRFDLQEVVAILRTRKYGTRALSD